MKRSMIGFLNSKRANTVFNVCFALFLYYWIVVLVLWWIGSSMMRGYQNRYRHTESQLEKSVREWIVPELIEKNGLKECPVKDAFFGCTHFKIETDSPENYAKITEDVIRLEQETRKDRKSHTNFILEFDHDKPEHGISVFLYTGGDSSSVMFDQWRNDSFWIPSAR